MHGLYCVKDIWTHYVHRILHFGFPLVNHVHQTIFLIHLSQLNFLTFLWCLLNRSKIWIIHNRSLFSNKVTELLQLWKCYWLAFLVLRRSLWKSTFLVRLVVVWRRLVLHHRMCRSKTIRHEISRFNFWDQEKIQFLFLNSSWSWENKFLYQAASITSGMPYSLYGPAWAGPFSEIRIWEAYEFLRDEFILWKIHYTYDT